MRLTRPIYSLPEIEKETGIKVKEILRAAAGGWIKVCVFPEDDLTVYSAAISSTDIDDIYFQKRKFDLKIKPSKEDFPKQVLHIRALVLTEEYCRKLAKKDETKEVTEASFYKKGYAMGDQFFYEEFSPNSNYKPGSAERIFVLYPSQNKSIEFEPNTGFLSPIKLTYTTDKIFVTKEELERYRFNSDRDSFAIRQANELLWNFFEFDKKNILDEKSEDFEKWKLLLEVIPKRLYSMLIMAIKHWEFVRKDGDFDAEAFKDDLEDFHLSFPEATPDKKYAETALTLVANIHFLTESGNAALLANKQNSFLKPGKLPPPLNKLRGKSKPVEKEFDNESVVTKSSVMIVLAVWKKMCWPFVESKGETKEPTRMEIIKELCYSGLPIGDKSVQGVKNNDEYLTKAKDLLPGRVARMFEIENFIKESNWP